MSWMTKAVGSMVLVAAAASPAVAAPRGTYKVIPAGTEPVVAAADIAKIIFLNRCTGGCTFRQGPASSSMMNITILGTGPDGAEYLVPEFAYGDALWDEIVACVQETYAPYDVTVTDVDPGTTTPHHEAVVGGYADAIGHDPNFVGGIGPLYSDCSLHDNTVSFTFSNSFPADASTICAVIAQETGHGFGIEHSLNCADPMTYLPACGLQYFRNEIMPCGEYEVRPCSCGGGQQNVHSEMYAVFGPNPAPLPAPNVTLAVPQSGAIVTDGFTIGLGASNRRGVGKIELWFNDWLWTTVETDTEETNWILTAPGGLPDGVIDLEVRVYNDLETVYGSRTATVTKGAACTAPESCAAGQRCEEGRCRWDPPVGALGDDCDYAEYCTSLRCEGGQCTQPCFVNVQGECPEAFECVPPQEGAQMGFCLDPSDEGGGGCCSTGDASPGALAAQLGLVGLVLGGALRRRQRRR
jgi:hypothetical protein